MEIDRIMTSNPGGAPSDNIKTFTRDYILNNICCGIGNVRWGFKVLILDNSSMRMIDTAVEMKDITKAGVSDVCLIDNNRLRLSKLDGIYFLSPTQGNVEKIISDFEDEPKYKRVHLFFTSRLPDQLLRGLAQTAVMARIKTLKEVNLQYLVYDSHIFHFDTPSSLFHLYSQIGNQSAEQKEIAERLASVIATLGEYPVIRHARHNANCSAIASLVHERVDKYRKGGLIKSSSNARCTLLILDRTHDLIAPIIHELYYQPMIEDFLSLYSSTNTISSKILNDVYKYNFKDGEDKDQSRTVILSEKDPIWCEIRNMHIESARNWITQNFKKFREEHSDMGHGHDLTKQLRAMPKFQTLKSKFSVHISLTKECMEIYSRNGLERICSVEQDLATGLDEEHKKVSFPYEPLKPILHDQNVSKENKQRLLMLYYATYPKAIDVRKMLESGAMLTESEEKLLTNWISLAEQTTKNQQRPPASQQEWEYVVSRYMPSLFDTVHNLANGSLSTKDFPFLFKEEESEVQRPAQPTQQKKLPTTAWVNKETQPKKTGPRLIIFIAGGVSYSEIRIIHKLTQKPYNMDVILGSTHIVDPPLFLKQIAALRTSVNDEAFKPSSEKQNPALDKK